VPVSEQCSQGVPGAVSSRVSRGIKGLRRTRMGLARSDRAIKETPILMVTARTLQTIARMFRFEKWNHRLPVLERI